MATPRSEFLDPLWRRVALVAFCFAWSGFEFWMGATYWGVIVGVFGLYGAWSYLYDYGRDEAPSKVATDGDQP